MSTLFIADIHLSAQHPHLTDLFSYFLSHEAPQADALYILGDLFDSWIGDDDLTPYHRKIISLLHHTAQTGLPIYIMPGNRDFLLGEYFSAQTGCQLLPDPSVIELYDEQVLLKHGDDLCLADHRHQQFRRFSHQNWVRQTFLQLPLSCRRSIANYLRKASKRRGKKLSTELMDVTPSAVKQCMQQHQVNHCIHGHTHRPSLHYFALNNTWQRHIVLSDWHEQGNMLVWQKNGEVQLRYFREKI